MVVFSDLFEVILDVLLSHFRTIELNVNIYIYVYLSVNVCSDTQHRRHPVSMELKEFVIFQLFRCIRDIKGKF